jgi:two-component system sensor histidine kinase KdpD
MPSSPPPVHRHGVVVAANGPAWAGWSRAAVVIALCTGIAELMHRELDLANIIMVYMAGVVYVALHEGARISVATVIASIFVFDLIYVEPRWGLNPLNPSHFFTFGVMLIVGLLISRLAARARSQTLLAQGRAERAQALSELSARLSAARSPGTIEDSVKEAVQSLFGAACHIAPASQDAPARFALRAPGGTLGDLVVDVPPAFLNWEDRELLQAFAAQTALALERCMLEHKSADALVAAESERLRNTLLASISHDLRTPLTTILGSATSLLQQDDRLDPAARRLLTSSVLGEAQRLHSVMSDLLDLTRMEEGAMQLSCEWCPADDLVNEALAACGDGWSRHHLQLDVADEAILWCDPRLIEQALVNMLRNALRYTPPGSTVRVIVRAQSGSCSVTVSDDGPGLPPGSEDTVFRKFQRGQREPTGGGFGLGLAICAAVARLHHGQIAAASDGGARFTLTWPQPEPPDVAQETT